VFSLKKHPIRLEAVNLAGLDDKNVAAAAFERLAVDPPYL
jgi:hypothetical protein